MTVVTGALRTSTTDVMEVHANLIPTELLLHRICHRATLHLAALPDPHPLHKVVKQTACRDIKHHRSSLHQLFHTFGLRPAECKTISLTTRPPNKEDIFLTRIAPTREVSKEEDRADQVKLQVYSDGSGLDGEAGAATVLFRGGQAFKMLRHYLGPLT